MVNDDRVLATNVVVIGSVVSFLGAIMFFVGYVLALSMIKTSQEGLMMGIINILGSFLVFGGFLFFVGGAIATIIGPFLQSAPAGKEEELEQQQKASGQVWNKWVLGATGAFAGNFILISLAITAGWNSGAYDFIFKIVTSAIYIAVPLMAIKGLVQIHKKKQKGRILAILLLFYYGIQLLIVGPLVILLR